MLPEFARIVAFSHFKPLAALSGCPGSSTLHFQACSHVGGFHQAIGACNWPNACRRLRLDRYSFLYRNHSNLPGVSPAYARSPHVLSQIPALAGINAFDQEDLPCKVLGRGKCRGSIVFPTANPKILQDSYRSGRCRAKQRPSGRRS